MIQITYLERRKPITHSFQFVGAPWRERCPHAAEGVANGHFYADRRESALASYTRLSCDECAVKLGIIW